MDGSGIYLGDMTGGGRSLGDGIASDWGAMGPEPLGEPVDGSLMGGPLGSSMAHLGVSPLVGLQGVGAVGMGGVSLGMAAALGGPVGTGTLGAGPLGPAIAMDGTIGVGSLGPPEAVGAPGAMIGGGSMAMDGGSLDAVLGQFPCVRLRGIPYEASVQDIVMFFQGGSGAGAIVDVVMPTSSDGKATGEAYVLFSNPMDTQLALQKDRQKMGRRYIEVFQAPRDVYYNAIARTMQAVGAGAKGSSAQDAPGQGEGAAGGGQGAKSSSQDAQGGKAMAGASSSDGKGKERGAGAGGSSSQSDGPGPSGSGSSAQSGSGGGSRRANGTTVLRMRGLPFSATRADVVHFFRDLEVIEGSIKFATRSDGRVTGEAYVEFDSPQTAADAMKRDRCTMGNRYVELFVSSRQEAAEKKGVH